MIDIGSDYLSPLTTDHVLAKPRPAHAASFRGRARRPSVAVPFRPIARFTLLIEHLNTQMGSKGGKRSLETMTPEERTARAKKAAKGK